MSTLLSFQVYDYDCLRNNICDFLANSPQCHLVLRSIFTHTGVTRKEETDVRFLIANGPPYPNNRLVGVSGLCGMKMK